MPPINKKQAIHDHISYAIARSHGVTPEQLETDFKQWGYQGDIVKDATNKILEEIKTPSPAMLDAGCNALSHYLENEEDQEISFAVYIAMIQNVTNEDFD